jgi:hypothetical protein
VENIAGYVFDHTTLDQSRWHRLGADERGPYRVSASHDPQKDRFLDFIHLHAEKAPRCNPLDGRKHRLSEIAGWIGNRALARRFIGLGVILGVFELVRQPPGRGGADCEDLIRRLDRGAPGHRRLEEARRSEPIASFPSLPPMPKCRKQPGRATPRWPRSGSRGTPGFRRSVGRGMAR